MSYLEQTMLVARHELSIKSLLPSREALNPAEPLCMSKIARACARAANIPLRDLMGPSRFMEHVKARHVFFWCCRELLLASQFSDAPISYPQLARFIHMDHTTVIYGVRKVNDRMDLYEGAIDAVEEILALKRELGR